MQRLTTTGHVLRELKIKAEEQKLKRIKKEPLYC